MSAFNAALKATIEHFLENTTGTVQAICKRLGDTSTATSARVESAIGTLELLNVIRVGARGDCILAHPDHARLFLRSLGQFLAAEKPVLDDFGDKGRERTWVQVLTALESRRQHLGPNAGPIRTVRTVVAAIVGVFEGVRYLLVEHEMPNPQGYNKMPGGKQQPGETTTATLWRELAEELQSNIQEMLTPAGSPLVVQLEACRISNGYGALTDYSVAVFSVEKYSSGRFTYQGSLGPSLRWLPVTAIVTAVQNNMPIIFLDTFKDGVLLNHLQRTEHTYAMSQEDMTRALR